jgi:formyltetrahydrofolate deformylase
MSENPKVLAVISVQGRDQKGVVAKFATYVAAHGINIEDMEQRVVRGIFAMDTLVDLHDMAISLDQLITGLLDLGRQIGMEARITLRQARKAKRVVVLVSKEPHCLEKLLELNRQNELNGHIISVLANHPVLENIARAAELPFAFTPCGPDESAKANHRRWLLEKLRSLNPDLIILARYMQILSPEIIAAFRSKIINIHPSLLPYFPGANPYRQAFESGVRVTGCTAHFVTEELDKGPIILQDVFHINVGVDQAEDVRQRGLELEAQTLGKAVKYFLNEELVVVEDKVVFKPGVSSFHKANDATISKN